MALEQIFILQQHSTFWAEYLGVDPSELDYFAHKRGETSVDRLPEFEAMLTARGFTRDSMTWNFHIWVRRGETLALGDPQP